MNFIYKAYCRTFQFCLKVALPFLPYRDPVILNDVSLVANELNKLKLKKPLIVTDKVLMSLNLPQSLLNLFDQVGIKYHVFDEVVANPTSNNVVDALKIYKDNECDSLIAIGGGSVIDCAKGIGARVARPKKSLKQMKGILKVLKKIPVLFAIPTTAGTGSETTLACVIVDSDTRHKYAINDFPLIPKYAVLDGKFIENLPPHITSTTGMDALTHAIEAYIGRGGNKKTRTDALNACKIIFENLYISYNVTSLDVKNKMLEASYLAGRAFSKAYVGSVHSLAHALGGKYNIAHGLANAIILPYVLKAYGSKVYKKLHEISVYCNISTVDADIVESANKLISLIEELNKKMNIPTHLHLEKEDLNELATYAYKETNPLYPVPVLWSKEKYIEIYKQIGDIHD